MDAIDAIVKKGMALKKDNSRTWMSSVPSSKRHGIEKGITVGHGCHRPSKKMKNA